MDDERAFYNLGYYWINQDYRKAFDYCLSKQEILLKNHPDLLNLTFSFENEKKKSAAFAAFMSAVFPGSGKAYSKRWGDALVSFLFFGTNAFASYRGFKKKGTSSINGWIFGTLAVSFYSANIWGSAKAAKKYNTDVINRYQQNAENIIYSGF